MTIKYSHSFMGSFGLLLQNNLKLMIKAVDSLRRIEQSLKMQGLL